MRKYRLISKKGEGTFAEVIKAQNIKTGTLHAIKCMKTCYKSADQVSSLREIQAIKRLSPHPNVVKLDEVLFDPPSGRLALVFELMEGNLYELMRDRKESKSGLFSNDTVKSFMSQIFAALDHMHSKGVFHRNIKPENILVDKSGRHLKLAGFSSCRGACGNPPFTEHIGTRWYRPPEVLLTCGMYGPEVDVWGAGCILFELTALYPLFHGTSGADQINRIHRVLGTPKTDVIAKLKQNASSGADFDFQMHEGAGLKMLLPETTAVNCLDLLTQSLAYDKSDRITSSEAMKHSYFVGDIQSQTRNTMDSPGNYKRRRTLFDSSANINDLSADLCCIIANFLPKTSRLLLAVALTAPSSSFSENSWKGQPNTVSKEIISRTKAGRPFATILDEICQEDRAEFDAKGKHRGLKMWVGEEYDRRFRQCLSGQLKNYYECHQWEVMDFVDIPLSLASKLTDDDVAAILLSIDAKNNLEQLKLTHCSNIVGHGLEPLRRSSVLERLDLGLVRQFEAPYLSKISGGRSDEFLFDYAKLSEGSVCDIIDSILREEGNCFKRLQYPYKWSENSSETDALVSIYDRNVLRSERMRQLVKEHGAIVNKFACSLYFGFEDEKEFCLSFEERWESDLVDACIVCNDASFAVCSNCNDIVCFECCETDECNVCNIMYCPRCIRDDGFENEVTSCEAARYGSDCPSYCTSCRVRSCRNGTNACSECRSEVFDTLLDECVTKQVQIASQNDEMERLRSVIDELTIQADRVQGQGATISDPPRPDSDSSIDSDDDDDSAFGDDAVKEMTVEGAGVYEINGIYIRCGQNDGVSKFMKTLRYNGRLVDFMLFRCKLADGTRRWYISIVPENVHPGTTQDIDFYEMRPQQHHSVLDQNIPPRDGWMAISSNGGGGPQVYPKESTDVP